MAEKSTSGLAENSNMQNGRRELTKRVMGFFSRITGVSKNKGTGKNAKRKKRAFIACVLVVVIVGGSFLGYRHFLEEKPLTAYKQQRQK